MTPYPGFGPTRELDAFEIWNGARNLGHFRRGLQYFDVGSLDWAYADVPSNVACVGLADSGQKAVQPELAA